MMEERISSIKKAIRVYGVGNVSFSTDKEHYGNEDRYCDPKADFWFNHLGMNGEVHLMNDGNMNAYLELDPNHVSCASFHPHPSLKEGRLSREGRLLFHRFFGETILTPGGVLLMNLKRNNGEFLTYDNPNKVFLPSSLTFEFYKPNKENNKTCIYRIHTHKIEFDGCVDGNERYPGYYSASVSPLEIITLNGENR